MSRRRWGAQKLKKAARRRNARTERKLRAASAKLRRKMQAWQKRRNVRDHERVLRYYLDHPSAAPYWCGP